MFSRPRYLERFRDEVMELVTLTERDDGKSGRIACLQASQLEKKPLVAAVYWETHRLFNEGFGNRRVMKDTTIKDPIGGREYPLVKGTDVQYSAGAPHRNKTLWGEDAEEFKPERWVDSTTPLHERQRRATIFPFGGGRTLCPGRSFAISESIGFVAVLSVVFEIEGIQVPRAVAPLMAGAMRRAVWGKMDQGMRIRRRKGWEDVTWKFDV